jgi:hypothetical protein
MSSAIEDGFVMGEFIVFPMKSIGPTLAGKVYFYGLGVFTNDL